MCSLLLALPFDGPALTHHRSWMSGHPYRTHPSHIFNPVGFEVRLGLPNFSLSNRPLIINGSVKCVCKDSPSFLFLMVKDMNGYSFGWAISINISQVFWNPLRLLRSVLWKILILSFVKYAALKKKFKSFVFSPKCFLNSSPLPVLHCYSHLSTPGIY